MAPRLGRASPWSSVRGLSKHPSHAPLPNTCRNQRQELRSSRTRADRSARRPGSGLRGAGSDRGHLVQGDAGGQAAFSDSVADVIGIRTGTSQDSATIRDRPRPSGPVTRTSGAVARSRSRIGVWPALSRPATKTPASGWLADPGLGDDAPAFTREELAEAWGIRE
jgi:hypothetical protein